MNVVINPKAMEYLGMAAPIQAPFEQRKQAAASSLCEVPGVEDVTNVEEQLALGGHMATSIELAFNHVIERMAEAETLARHKPAVLLAALETCRALGQQLDMLEHCLAESCAHAMSEYVSTLPEAEAERMMQAAKARVEAKIAQLGMNGDDGLAGLLERLFGGRR